MNIFKIIVVVCFVICISSCSDETVSVPETGVLLPLKVGNYWKYKYQTFLPNGTVMSTRELLESVDNEMMVNNQQWYTIYKKIDSIITLRSQYINKSDGVYYSQDSGKTTQLLYKYPVAVNEITIVNGDSTKIIATQQDVVVPSGTFKCIVYQKRYYKTLIWQYENTYVAPNYGKIKEEILLTTDHVKFQKGSTVELIGYSVK